MGRSREIPEETLLLIEAAAADRLDDEQFARLEQLIRDDSTTAQCYLDYMQFEVNLHLKAYQQRSLAACRTMIEAIQPTEPGSPSPVESKCDMQNFFGTPSRWSIWRTQAALPVPSHAVASPSRTFAGRWLSTTVASAMITLAFWGVFFLFFLLCPGLVEMSQDPSDPVADVLQPVVAELVETFDAVWLDDSSLQPTAGTPLRQGDTLNLTAGLVQLRFQSGARVALQGPATFVLSGRNAAWMELGRTYVQASGNAVGFTIETPAAMVVDLGTEFGVVVEKNQACDVFVYDGTVEVEPLGADSCPSGNKHRLAAGQSLRVGPAGTIEPATGSDPQQLARHLPESTANTEGSDAYAQAVLASKPLAYWRFEETEGDRVTDASGNGNDAKYGEKVWRGLSGVPPARYLGLEKNNRAAGFPGLSNFSVAPGERITTRLAELSDDYTVELWLRNDRPIRERRITGYFFSRAVANKGDEIGDHWNIRARGIPGMSSDDGCISCYAGLPRRKSSPFGTTQTKPRAWYHVALVRDNDVLRLYVNGNKTPEFAEPAAYSLRPGSNFICVGGRNDGRLGFRGRVDEVALFARALKPEEIATHYRAAVEGDPRK